MVRTWLQTNTKPAEEIVRNSGHFDSFKIKYFLPVVVAVNVFDVFVIKTELFKIPKRPYFPVILGRQ